MTEWLPIQADAQAPDPTDSASLSAVKEAIADLLQTDLGYLGLKAFAHPPGVISEIPAALIYLVTPGMALLTISSSAPVEADTEWDATLEIALLSDPMAGDPIRLAARAEDWIDPVFRALHKNFSLGNRVWNSMPISVLPTPIKFGGDPAAPAEWYGPVFRVGVTLLYTHPRIA